MKENWVDNMPILVALVVLLLCVVVHFTGYSMMWITILVVFLLILILGEINTMKVCSRDSANQLGPVIFELLGEIRGLHGEMRELNGEIRGLRGEVRKLCDLNTNLHGIDEILQELRRHRPPSYDLD